MAAKQKGSGLRALQGCVAREYQQQAVALQNMHDLSPALLTHPPMLPLLSPPPPAPLPAVTSMQVPLWSP
jgi:hypothetical protein